MILLASLFGTPLELFGTEPNQDLIFRSYVNSFSNTKTWVLQPPTGALHLMRQRDEPPVTLVAVNAGRGY